MKKTLLLAASVLFCALPFALAEGGHAAAKEHHKAAKAENADKAEKSEKADKADPEYPMVGRVSASGALNVRSAPSQEATLLGQLKNGDEVVVVARKGEFYQLQYPKQLQAWIAGWMLLGNGKPGKDVVSREDVNVRSGPSTDHASIATLKKGAEVEVIEANKEKWARINPPMEATAWVAGKFISTGETVRAHKETQQRKDEGARLLAECDGRLKAHLANGTITEDEYQSLFADLGRVSQMMPGTNEDRQALEMKIKLTNLNNLARINDIKKQTEAEQADKMKAAQEDYKKKLDEARAAPPKVEKKFQYEGWLEDIGGILFRPATHVLKEGGKATYYARCEKNGINLDDFTGKRVGINGTAQRFRGWGRIIDVEEIEVLYEGPAPLWTPK